MEYMIKLSKINDAHELTKILSHCPYETTIYSGRYVVDAKSIMGLFSLDLTKPLKLVIESDDETLSVISEIQKYIVSGE